MAEKEKKADKGGAAAEKPAKKAPPSGAEGKAKRAKGEKKAAGETATAETGGLGRSQIPARLRTKYASEVVPALMKEFGYKNIMQVPKVEKVVVNVGLGEALQNAKLIDSSVEQVSALTGQKPVVTRARKAIANFKLRAGQPIGVMVTLRNDRMFEFLDRLMNVALPRVRDFKGVSSKAFDGAGNYTLGIKEQIIFPEINYDQVDKIKGMNITVVTTAKTDEEARALLRNLGMPFRTA